MRLVPADIGAVGGGGGGIFMLSSSLLRLFFEALNWAVVSLTNNPNFNTLRLIQTSNECILRQKITELYLLHNYSHFLGNVV